MAVWSECEGVIVMKKGSGFSVKKCWEGLYDELSYSETVEHLGDSVKTSFKVCFSLDGLPAARCVNEFVESATANKMYSWSQITANIRFT